jgi:hypothetical protein
MTKKFTLLQLFNIVDGRLSTNMDDIYAILNHVTGENLFTHQLPFANNYLKSKRPIWYREVENKLEEIKRIHVAATTFNALMYVIKEEYNIEYEIPQLSVEFDISDFNQAMSANSPLNVIMIQP